jgi:hypothetical protein
VPVSPIVLVVDHRVHFNEPAHAAPDLVQHGDAAVNI